jgi:hypothetical protein
MGFLAVGRLKPTPYPMIKLRISNLFHLSAYVILVINPVISANQFFNKLRTYETCTDVGYIFKWTVMLHQTNTKHRNIFLDFFSMLGWSESEFT